MTTNWWAGWYETTVLILVFGRTERKKEKSQTLCYIMTGDTNWYFPCVIIGVTFIDEGLLQNELRH